MTREKFTIMINGEEVEDVTLDGVSIQESPKMIEKTYDLDVSGRVIDRVAEKIDEYYGEYGDLPDHVVVGPQTYGHLYAYAQSERFADSPCHITESSIDGIELVVIPQVGIHAVGGPVVELRAYERERDADD